MSLLKDVSLSALVAGFIAVVIGYASSAVIIFQAAQAGALSDPQTASWLAAVSLGCGVFSLYFSWKYRIPVIAAWSTGGAALMIVALPIYGLRVSISAYLLSASLVIVSGMTGLFQKFMQKIPMSLVAAMLAGILLQFCLHSFAQIAVQPVLVLSMCITYFILKLLVPRYAIVITLLVGIALVLMQFDLAWSGILWTVSVPTLTTPQWSWAAVLGVALPLFIVAMTSQNASGFAVLRASGYQVPESKLITATGVVSLVTAPFGSHGVTMAAITAAICSSADCHPDPKKRYIAGLSCGFFYVLFAVFSLSMVQLFALVPDVFVVTVAGLALFSACSHALKTALSEDEHLDAAMLTFLVTASGLTFWGIGAAFWGLCAGLSFFVFKNMCIQRKLC